MKEKKTRLDWIQIVAIAFIALFCVAVALFGYHIEEEKKNDQIAQTSCIATSYGAYGPEDFII